MGGLILAVRFLTIVPVPGGEATGAGALGRAAWWFPAVGLVLGGLLVGLDRVLALMVPPLLGALLVLSAWKVLTGGIHLDGLADCLDGLGGRSVEHRRSIMKDSRIGVFGALGLILTFLIALTALGETPSGPRAAILWLTPSIGRWVPLAVAPWLPAAAPGAGLAGPFLAGLSRAAGASWFGALLALAGWCLGPAGLALVVAAVVTAGLAAWLFAWRLGGLSGDVLGASVELAELAALVGGAALAHRGLA